MGPPPVKSTKKLIKAELDTKAKFRLSQRGIQVSILEMIDRIDPIEFLAVLSGSFIVYDIIKGTPEMMAQAKVTWFTSPAVDTSLTLIGRIIEIIQGKDPTYPLILTPEQQLEFDRVRKELDPILFVKSFFISYILVKHSGQIIAGVGNITGFIAGFLGLKAV